MTKPTGSHVNSNLFFKVVKLYDVNHTKTYTVKKFLKLGRQKYTIKYLF